MNEKAFNLAYTSAIKNGYKNDLNSFKILLQTNNVALRLAHEEATKNGYKGDLNAFYYLLFETKLITNSKHNQNSDSFIKITHPKYGIIAFPDYMSLEEIKKVLIKLDKNGWEMVSNPLINNENSNFLNPQRRDQLDSNIREMLAKGASKQDVINYANDFKAKYSINSGNINLQQQKNTKSFFDELSSFFGNEEENQLVEETTTEVVEPVLDYDHTEVVEPVVSDYETTQTNRDYNQEFILIDPMTKLRWKIFKNEFWWIYYPLLLLAFFLVYKLSRFSFRWIKQNLSIAKLKEFFITINANELKVLNVHKRMCQFLTVLCIYVLIKRNHFQQPLFLIVYAIIISFTWFLYYFIKTFSAKILHILIRYEKIVLYSIIMNFIHQNYSYFYGDGSHNGLLYLGYFPAIVYIIIYIFNLKTSINFPFLNQLKKINPVTNFYIQQNIYLTFLLSISYLTGKFELNYILYVVVFIWVGSLLYSKLFDKSE